MSSPSVRARELVRGGFDVHVHIAPDVVERRIDDVALARRFVELGLAGFVLKSHYTSTAERARVVRAVVPATAALGAIALNRAVGGLNPLAVEIAAREGARMVWLPTVDAVNEADAQDAADRARQGAGLGAAPARAARARDRDRSGRGRRRRRRGLLPETRAVLAACRGARAGARHRPSRARRELRGRRRARSPRASRTSSSPTPTSRPGDLRSRIRSSSPSEAR